MDVKELRIGNMVNYQGFSPHFVTSIDIRHCEFASTAYKPITITEKWLKN